MHHTTTLENYLNIFLRNKPRNKAVFHIGSYLDFNEFKHDGLYGTERTFKSVYNSHPVEVKLTFRSDGDKYLFLSMSDKEIVSVKLTSYDESYNNECIAKFKKNFMRRMLGGR